MSRGVAIAGDVHSESGIVVESRFAAWVGGPLWDWLAAELDVPVSVVEDGDAHAFALTHLPELR